MKLPSLAAHLPCRFCGARPRWLVYDAAPTTTHPPVSVECSNKDCPVQPCTRVGTARQAMEDWNTRAA